MPPSGARRRDDQVIDLQWSSNNTSLTDGPNEGCENEVDLFSVTLSREGRRRRPDNNDYCEPIQVDILKSSIKTTASGSSSVVCIIGGRRVALQTGCLGDLLFRYTSMMTEMLSARLGIPVDG